MKRLLHAGYTLIGLQLYDCVLAIDYFLSKNLVKNANLFVLGHSVGGEIATYLGIIDTRVKHVITDNKPYRFNRMANSSSFHNEFIPDYYKIQYKNLEPLINDIDILAQEYGFNDKLATIDWIKERL